MYCSWPFLLTKILHKAKLTIDLLEASTNGTFRLLLNLLEVWGQIVDNSRIIPWLLRLFFLLLLKPVGLRWLVLLGLSHFEVGPARSGHDPFRKIIRSRLLDILWVLRNIPGTLDVSLKSVFFDGDELIGIEISVDNLFSLPFFEQFVESVDEFLVIY